MWSIFIKTLSETAHVNRGHDEEVSFHRRWSASGSASVAMAIVKTGAEVATRQYSEVMGAAAVAGTDDT